MLVNVNRFGAFGAPSKTTAGVECAAGGSWETWCDCMYEPTVDPVNNKKCRQQMFTAPWTVAGAILRGIPHASGIPALDPSMVPTGTPSTYAPGSASLEDQGLFGLPSYVTWTAGGVLALGALALALRGPAPKPVNGYRRRRRSRR